MLQNFVYLFLADPFYYFGALFAGFAAILFITFLSGFLSGFKQLITLSEHEGHLEHFRTRMVFGVGWLLLLFGTWETIQIIVGHAPLSRLILVAIAFSVLWIPWLTARLKKLTAGGGH